MIKISRLLLFVCLMMGSVVTVLAQDNKKNEFYAGYTYLRSDFSTNSHGFEASLTRYITKNFGFTAEAARLYNRQIFRFGPFGSKTSVDLSTYMIGPKYAFHNKTRLTPFAQALFGFYHIKNEFSGGSPAFDFNSSSSLNSFASAVGGGLDVRLTNTISVRTVELDYQYLRQLGSSHNTRLTTGIVIKF